MVWSCVLLLALAGSAAALQWSPQETQAILKGMNMAGKASSFSPWRSTHRHPAAYIQTGHRFNGTSNTTATPSCEQKFMAFGTEMTKDPNCVTLMSQLEKEFDPSACSNPCWEKMMAGFDELIASGCQDSDVDLRSVCESDAMCSAPEAVLCVNDWIAMGCTEDDALMQRCARFGICAMKAQQEGRCQQIEIVTIPSNHTVNHNCTNLRNCSHHGDCVNGACVCHTGYGRRRVGATQDCSEWTLDDCKNNCTGNGQCVPATNGSMVCRCKEGYSGEDCNTWHGCQSLGYCHSHGVCHKHVQASTEECVCIDGYTGADCATPEDLCPNQCSGRGICRADEGETRRCHCESGFTGLGCEQSLPAQCPSDCHAHGSCQNGQCTCVGDAHGLDCSEVDTSCKAGCGHGHCEDNACKCTAPFTGPACNTYNATQDTGCGALNFCSGYGVCHLKLVDGHHIPACTCFEGFGGASCNTVDAAEHCPNYCGGHGTCVLLQSPHCKCVEGWTGAACNESLCPTHNGKTCNGRGVCDKESENVFRCTCDSSWSHGQANACEVPLCPFNCNSHGTCGEDGRCACSTGFSGDDCGTIVEATPPTEDDSAAVEQQPCVNDCSGHGSCTDGVCSCVDGFVGEDCSIAPALPDDTSDGLETINILLQENEDKSLQATPPRSMASLWD